MTKIIINKTTKMTKKYQKFKMRLRVKFFLWIAALRMTRENAYLRLAKSQLRIIGFRGNLAAEVKRDGWYSENAWPDLQTEEVFRDETVKLLQRKFGWTKKIASQEWSWFNLCHGLCSARSKAIREAVSVN
jgi:hypothetical protein